MNNNFQRLAEQFVDRNSGGDILDQGDLENEVRAFIANQGIDPAWEDELFEVITEYWNECNS